MAQFKPYKITSEQLDDVPIVEGQMIYSVDTSRLYFDIDDERKEVTIDPDELAWTETENLLFYVVESTFSKDGSAYTFTRTSKEEPANGYIRFYIPFYIETVRFQPIGMIDGALDTSSYCKLYNDNNELMSEVSFSSDLNFGDTVNLKPGYYYAESYISENALGNIFALAIFGDVPDEYKYKGDYISVNKKPLTAFIPTEDWQPATKAYVDTVPDLLTLGIIRTGTLMQNTKCHCRIIDNTAFFQGSLCTYHYTTAYSNEIYCYFPKLPKEKCIFNLRIAYYTSPNNTTDIKEDIVKCILDTKGTFTVTPNSNEIIYGVAWLSIDGLYYFLN